MKKILLVTILILANVSLWAQSKNTLERPKLVVGIVVDQMRYDYLTRFYEKYGEDGFKRLMREGHTFDNAHFNYIPTVTAVGHASVYTGTTGSTHGIIGNDWYDKFEKRSVYCVDDSNYKAVGSESEGERKSPHRMLTTTITDELRLAQNMKGKTIAIGLKDRSSVLPGGHTSNGSYWFRGYDEGNFISSSYYLEALPKWVVQFNKSGLVDRYMSQKWETLMPIESYTESIEDDNIYEEPFNGELKPVFPHDLSKLKETDGNYEMIRETPFGNNLVAAFAKAAIKGEKLGEDRYSDFLAISFSSPDYIGHQFGVNSKEVQDTYLRLDRDIADLLVFLDEEIGKGEYTLFLTADHAAVQVPAYLKSLKIPGGYFDSAAFAVYVQDYCRERWGSAELIENISNSQIFLSASKLEELKLDRALVSEDLVDLIIDYNGIHKAVSFKTMQKGNFERGILSRLRNGYNQKSSGDVLWVLDPAVISGYSQQGSAHGSGYSYDSHVPIIFFGKGVKEGRTSKEVNVIDIAPTLSSLLKISFPNGSSGRVLDHILE